MSTIRANNIGKTTGSTQDTMEGLAKAWANLNGTGTIGLRDSFNIATSTFTDDDFIILSTFGDLA